MKRLAALTIAVLASVLFLAAVQEQKAPVSPAQAPPAQTPGAAVARVSLLNGKAFLQRASDLGFEEAALNMPVVDGDRLGTTDGRAEVHLGMRTYVRLDNNTKIDLQTLPRRGDPLTRVRLWAGSVYLEIGALEKEKSVEVLTQDATFYVLDEGLYRIDVAENGRTEILVFRGLIEAAGQDGSMLVKKEQRLALSAGRFDGRPSTFFAGAEDSFDRWNGDRTTIVNRSYAQRYLPEELAEYEAELDESGDWNYLDPHGYVWVPRGMGSDWRPYSWGRWMWMSMYGWSWIPYESWGWSVYHYGRWHWQGNLGWYWIPMSGWGPAWVNWWWDDYYYGWAPMSYWGYPGVIIDNFYYGRGWTGDYPFNSRALTVVRKNQLQAPDIKRVAVGSDALRSVGKISLTSKSPNVAPGRGVSVEPMGGTSRVILRRDGETVPVTEGGRLEGTAAGSKDRVIRSTEGGTKTVETKGDASKGTSTTGTRVVERPAKGETGAKTGTTTTTPPPERKIRKKEGGGEAFDLTPYPSSSRITRESAGSSGATRQGTIIDRFYRSFSGEGGTTVRSGSTSSGSSKGTTPRSTPRVSSGSSSGRSGSSSAGRSGSSSAGRSSGGSSRGSSGGSVRKK